MDLMEAMKSRHSVRSYKDQAISGDTRHELQAFISQLNQESGLNMQLILNEPKAFSGLLAHYGKFFGAVNYIALGERTETGRDLRILWGKGRTEGPAAGAEYLLGSTDLQQGQRGFPDKEERKTALCDCRGLWCNPGHRAPGETHRKALYGRRPAAPMVPAGRGGGTAGPHRHESAKISFFAQE